MTQTKMRTFFQNKLWRDKLVDIMQEKHNSRINWRYLSDEEFNQELRLKLAEETQDVIVAQSRDELIAELADVYEVIDSLAKLHGATKQEIVTAQTKKRDERGGFEGRKFVETAEHLAGSFGEKYCLADPIKYPEIISE